MLLEPHRFDVALQMAPFDMDYTWPNVSGTFEVGDRWHSELNEYRGGIYQQVSAVHRLFFRHLVLGVSVWNSDVRTRAELPHVHFVVSPSRRSLVQTKDHIISRIGIHSRHIRTNICPASERTRTAMRTGHR